MKILPSLKTLIVEIASVETIIDYVKNRKRCIINYDGDEPGGKGLREIEPVAFGVSKAGNLVLSAWENEGASHKDFLGTKPLPSWRFFRLDKILSIKPTGETFDTPHEKFNPNGDKRMKSVYIVSKF